MHEFDSGVFVKQPAWHGLGVVVDEAPNSKEALKLAGLDWGVRQEELFTSSGAPLGFFANLRDKDNAVLGVVGKNYKVLQNYEAFDFMDALIGKEVRYESAGSLRNGKIVWLLARREQDVEILGDKINPYIFLMNSHDGSLGVQAAFTNVRIVCMNTLRLAIRGAENKFCAKHTRNLKYKVEQAKRLIGLLDNYTIRLSEEAERLVRVKISPSVRKKWTESIFIEPADLSRPRQIANAYLRKEEFEKLWDTKPDLGNFRYTAWGAYNALTDFFEHREPGRKTGTWQENRLIRVLDHRDINMATKKLMSLV